MRNEREAHMVLSNTATEVAKARKVLAAKRKAREPTEKAKEPTLAFIKRKTRINSTLSIVNDRLHALAGEKVIKL